MIMDFGLLAKRVLSAFIDYVVAGILGFLIFYFLEVFDIVPINYIPTPIFDISFPIFLVFLFFLNKDIVFKDGSLGKKLMKIKVELFGNNRLKVLRLIFRNVFSFFWPLEFLFILFYGKKVGDFMCCTKVVN